MIIIFTPFSMIISMSPIILALVVFLYFLILLAVAWLTSRNSNNESFFIGNRNSNWVLVAFGMIGTSLSGVTFVSVPGGVAKDSFAYFQITIGYFIGYIAIAYLLLPLYYRLQLTSIYHFLSTRLGNVSYKTGASFFILSRTLGATARLYLVVNILQESILQSFNIPFWVTTFIILMMIIFYTFKGGVKTIVWTDTLQTTCMLGGLIVCVIFILSQLHLSIPQSLEAMSAKGYTQVFFTNPASKLFFVKQIIAGAFITLTMTGMDQEMMQKNISVKTLANSQKNVLSLSVIMLVVIMLFLFLGGLLYLYADQLHISAVGDKLFPTIALHYMPPFVSIIFIIALISALFPSADGAITALTSSFCIDLLAINTKPQLTDAAKKRTRQIVHLSFAFIFLFFVMIYKWCNNPSMIGVILKIAAYTYGPLLGLFAFSMLTKKEVQDKLVPIVCILSPIACYFIDMYQEQLFGNFKIGLELLLINGFFTFLGLNIISKPALARKLK